MLRLLRQAKTKPTRQEGTTIQTLTFLPPNVTSSIVSIMLTPQQRNSAGHFRTKPDPLTISTKVEDWFEASYHDHQESLMTDHEITGLVVVTDGYVTVLEGPKVSRGARNNRILSACSGTPAEFNVFSSKALDLCREFVGFD